MDNATSNVTARKKIHKTFTQNCGQVCRWTLVINCCELARLLFIRMSRTSENGQQKWKIFYSASAATAGCQFIRVVDYLLRH